MERHLFMKLSCAQERRVFLILLFTLQWGTKCSEKNKSPLISFYIFSKTHFCIWKRWRMYKTFMSSESIIIDLCSADLDLTFTMNHVHHRDFLLTEVSLVDKSTPAYKKNLSRNPHPWPLLPAHCSQTPVLLHAAEWRQKNRLLVTHLHALLSRSLWWSIYLIPAEEIRKQNIVAVSLQHISRGQIISPPPGVYSVYLMLPCKKSKKL